MLSRHSLLDFRAEQPSFTTPSKHSRSMDKAWTKHSGRPLDLYYQLFKEICCYCHRCGWLLLVCQFSSDNETLGYLFQENFKHFRDKTPAWRRLWPLSCPIKLFSFQESTFYRDKPLGRQPKCFFTWEWLFFRRFKPC